MANPRFGKQERHVGKRNGDRILLIAKRWPNPRRHNDLSSDDCRRSWRLSFARNSFWIFRFSRPTLRSRYWYRPSDITEGCNNSEINGLSNDLTGEYHVLRKVEIRTRQTISPPVLHERYWSFFLIWATQLGRVPADRESAVKCIRHIQKHSNRTHSVNNEQNDE